ncbi:hypothetical protein SAMN05421505_120135 [Sinosporangium album]|uniref:Uncharacterized protein n=1 Tax=Sinosporangium album TaxID=504805 RepID=A0A1G8EK50_9ACTN|nr:hypothetical protein [Sinosporangium album]SDH70257.1 hypothetical protein SAMN05421505_120135 [Sinosporangium album]
MKSETKPTPINGWGRLAQIVSLTKRFTGDTMFWSLTIDGHELPYYLTPDTVIPVPHTELPSIVLSLYAEHIQTDHHLRFLRKVGDSYQDVPHEDRWVVPPAAPLPNPPADPAQWGDKTRFPSLIQIRRFGVRQEQWALLIDGETFPYLLGAECTVPIGTEDTRTAMPRVQVTLLAERLLVDLEGPGDPRMAPRTETAS